MLVQVFAETVTYVLNEISFTKWDRQLMKHAKMTLMQLISRLSFTLVKAENNRLSNSRRCGSIFKIHLVWQWYR